MKTYLSLFKIRFINDLQYRAAALAGLSTQFFFGIVFIMVYVAFYESNSEVKPPMNLEEVVSYLWLNQAFFALVYVWIKENEFLSMIKNGNMAYELCRPISFYKKWFASMYGHRIASVSLRVLPVIIFALLLPTPYKLMLPPNIETFLLFIISLIISSFLVTSIAYIYHIITFYILDERGVMTLLMVVAEIFSGGTVPIVFFPRFMQIIAACLPFRYIADLPFRIYSGNIPFIDAIPYVLGGMIWTLGMMMLGNLLTKNALKKAIIQGG